MTSPNENQTTGVVIDARYMIDGRPAALYQVLDRPWLEIFLNVVERARALPGLTVVAPAGFESEIQTVIRDHLPEQEVKCTTEMPESSTQQILTVSQIYINSKLTRLIRRGKLDFRSAMICEIRSVADMNSAEAFAYRDREFTLARYLNMPMARWMAVRLSRTSVTPNLVTIAGGLVRLAAALAMAMGSYPFNLLAVALVQLSWSLDLTDGYLARLTGKSSPYGHWLDTIVDEVGNFLTIVGLTVGAARSMNSELWWLVGLAALFTYHMSTFGHLYDQLEESKTNGQTEAASELNIQKSTPHRVVSHIMQMSRSMDLRPQLFSVALLLNLVPVLLALLTILGLISLARYFQIKVQSQRHAS